MGQEKIYPKLKIRLMARLLSLFFRLLYHPMAWTYDLVAATVSLGQWKRWVATTIDLLKGPQVLELGFGPGHLQMRMREAGLDAFGLDESQQMAQQAASRQKQQRLSPRLARGVAQQLPFPNEAFDSVVATFPTQYIIDPVTLNEVRRVLRPGGQLVVLFAAWITGKSIPEQAMALLFQVTGQVPSIGKKEEAFLAHFSEAGFQAKIHWVEPDGSRLLFVTAEKT